SDHEFAKYATVIQQEGLVIQFLRYHHYHYISHVTNNSIQVYFVCNYIKSNKTVTNFACFYTLHYLIQLHQPPREVKNGLESEIHRILTEASYLEYD
ncbi:hypothetical protein ACJX0J_027572, partial [Zea mays]